MIIMENAIAKKDDLILVNKIVKSAISPGYITIILLNLKI